MSQHLISRRILQNALTPSKRFFSATAAPPPPSAPPSAPSTAVAVTVAGVSPSVSVSRSDYLNAPLATKPVVAINHDRLRLPRFRALNELVYSRPRPQTIHPDFPTDPVDFVQIRKDRRRSYDKRIQFYQLAGQTDVLAALYEREPHLDFPSKKHHIFRLIVGSWLNSPGRDTFVTLTGGKTVTIGITHTKIEALTRARLQPHSVQLPTGGQSFKQGDVFATIHCIRGQDPGKRRGHESKEPKKEESDSGNESAPEIVGTIDVKAPVDFSVLKSNITLNDNIFVLSERPEQGGWFVAATFTAPEQFEQLFECSPPGRVFFEIIEKDHGKRETPFYVNEVPVDYWQKKKAARAADNSKSGAKKPSETSTKTAKKAAKIAA